MEVEKYREGDVLHKEKKHIAREIMDLIRVLVIALAVVLPIRYFIAQPFIVRGASMEPNFENREYLIVDEMSYYFREPERGEPIIFRYPQDPRQFFIKRVIGLPGERIVIRNGQVSVHTKKNPEGLVLEEQYLPLFHRGTFPDIEIELGDREYFVLGDNRSASSDSRFWGPLEKEFIVGRAVFRAWPLDRFGIVSYENPPAQ